MKKFLTILLVLVVSFSLFVSCDPNIDKDDDKKNPTGGGTTQVDPSKEDQNNNGEKPSQDVPDKEAEGTTFSEIEINQLMGSYKGLYETLIKETPKIEGQPSKIELNVTAKFPNGLVLAKEEDYKKAAEDREDRNDESYSNLEPYIYKNINFELISFNWNEQYKYYMSSNSTIKYSNEENPTKDDYKTDEEGRIIKDFIIFGRYYGSKVLDGHYVQDPSILLKNLSGQKAIINGSLKLYGSDNTAITISTEGLTIAVSNDSEVSVKGDVKVISGDKTYVFTLDFSINFEETVVMKHYDNNTGSYTYTSIIPKKYTLTINKIGISSDKFGASLGGIASMSLNEQGVMESFKITINYTDSINGKENLKLNALFEIKPEDITNINNGGDLLAILDYLKIYEFKYSGQEYSADSVKAVIKSMIENMQKNPSNS